MWRKVELMDESNKHRTVRQETAVHVQVRPKGNTDVF